MKGSLIVILFFCVGCIMGALNKFQFDTHTISMYILYALMLQVQSPNQKIPDRKTKCVIKTHINIKQNVIFGAKLKPV